MGDGKIEAGRTLLVVFAGLPGSGKTTLSHGLSRELSAVCLRIDLIEAAIWRAGVAPSFATGLAAYLVAESLAEVHLALGKAVVIDAVNGVEPGRKIWRDLAARARVSLRFIELMCSDPGQHRQRVEGRQLDLEGFPLPTWDEVLSREYEPWDDSRLVLDTMSDQDVALTRIRAYLAGQPTLPPALTP